MVIIIVILSTLLAITNRLFTLNLDYGVIIYDHDSDALVFKSVDNEWHDEVWLTIYQ